MGEALPAALVHGELSLLMSALWFDIDHGDGTLASTFFTPDASLTFSRRTFVGTAEIDGVYRTRAARGPRVSRHVTTNLHLTVRAPAAIEAVSILTLYAQDGEPPVPTTVPVLVADVYDTFVRAADRDGDGRPVWLIAARRIETRFLAPGGVLAVPTE
ncbi:hypothetical protein FHX39_002023 [Friedmanniella antarctica]|uniref:SnoaL-like domain-containing protein n=1 Tax=Microlunatus antarcticus TaxID=53388 RepID=A0A7W5P706_9ACTN|nr:nuclear transport factor 2 family protein [Microlunatus antarcticus]MBB3327079.1 hypothetical protein [Microlunatus antarcticus]